MVNAAEPLDWLEDLAAKHNEVKRLEGLLDLAKADRQSTVMEARKAGVEPAALAAILEVTPAHISRIAPLKKQANPRGTAL